MLTTFVTIYIEFLCKFLCQIDQGDATLSNVFCKRNCKESPSFIEINKKVVRKTGSKTITCDFQILKSIT